MGLFSGFKKLLKKVTKPIAKVGGFLEKTIPGGEFIVPAAITAVNPAAGAAYQGTKTLGETGSLGSALLSAGGTYVGGKIGSNLGVGQGANIGGSIGDAIGGQAGNIGIAAGAGLGGAVGGAAGSQFGSSIAQGLGNAVGIGSQKAPREENQGTGVGPSVIPVASKPRQMAMQNPLSLGSAYAGLDPIQLRTSIASQDVYGQGASSEAQEYLDKETNNRLLKEGNYDITPVEEQYFQRRGYNFNQGDAKSLLNAFAKRYA